MNTLVSPSSRASGVPFRPSGTLFVLLFSVACAVAACDPGPIDATLKVSDASSRPAPLPAPHGQAAARAAYFGDEYADAQSSLVERTDAPNAPTF